MTAPANVRALNPEQKNEQDESVDNLDFNLEQEPSIFDESVKTQAAASPTKKAGGGNGKWILIGIGMIGVIAVGVWNAMLMLDTPVEPKGLKQSESVVENTNKPIKQPAFEVSDAPIQVDVPKSEEELALEKLMALEANTVEPLPKENMDKPAIEDEVTAPVSDQIIAGDTIKSADSIRLDQIESLARNGTDLAHSLVPRMDMVEKQITEQDAKLVMSQRAITQTAEAVQEVRSAVSDVNKSMKAMSAELNKLKNDVKSNEMQITKLEEKVMSVAETGRVRTLNNGQITTVQSQSVNPVAVQSKPVESEVQSVTTPAVNQQVVKQDVLNKYIQLSQLSVIAMTKNNAYVKDENNNKYLLTLNKTYEQLGTVENIDPNSKTIYGRFKNGKGWMIN